MPPKRGEQALAPVHSRKKAKVTQESEHPDSTTKCVALTTEQNLALARAAALLTMLEKTPLVGNDTPNQEQADKVRRALSAEMRTGEGQLPFAAESTPIVERLAKRVAEVRDDDPNALSAFFDGVDWESDRQTLSSGFKKAYRCAKEGLAKCGIRALAQHFDDTGCEFTLPTLCYAPCQQPVLFEAALRWAARGFMHWQHSSQVCSQLH